MWEAEVNRVCESHTALLPSAGKMPDIENRPMDTGRGEEGEGEMYGKSNMESYNTICKIDSQWEFAVWLRELKQELCDNLEGWDVEADGRELQEEGDIGVPMADSCWCMTENHKIL